MSNYTLSPNMNLLVPIVGVDPGPEYASDVNTSLTLVDGHDHSIGYGVQIQPAGLNISSDLTFQSHRATNVAALALVVQSSSPGTMNLFSMPAGTSPVANELFYTDNNGVTTQITSNGIVKTTASAIEGETYNTSTGTFIWTQTQSGFPTTPANFSVASLTLAPAIASTPAALTLMTPSGLTGAASITMPLTSGLSNPAFLTITTGGVMSPSVSTVGGIIGSNIASATITNTNIAANTITGGASGNIGLATITQANIASGAFQVDSTYYVVGTHTVTVPAGATYAYFTLCGGGGGGGAGWGDGVRVSGGGGGGAGCIPQFFGLSVSPGETLVLTAGAGGAGGTSFFNGANSGAAGGNSTITLNGFLMFTAYGGSGGSGGAGQGGGNVAGGVGYPSLMQTSGGIGGGDTASGSGGASCSFGYGAPAGSVFSLGGSGGGGGGGWFVTPAAGTQVGAGGSGSTVAGTQGGNGLSPSYSSAPPVAGMGGGGGGGGYNSLGGTGGNGSGGLILLNFLYI